MRFMNEYEIDEAQERFKSHPALGPATETLSRLRLLANHNSDGWAYWPKPVRAANKLMELIPSPYGETPEVTVAQVKKAFVPIKAFLARENLRLEFPPFPEDLGKELLALSRSL